MLLRNNGLQVLAAWKFTMDQNASPGFKQTLEENISAFVSKISKSNVHVRIEYLDTTRFKSRWKTYMIMEEFDDFANYADQSIHLSHGLIQLSCWEWSNECVQQSTFQMKKLLKGVCLHWYVNYSQDVR